MTIGFVDKAHDEAGLEWGQMWYLDLASPEMQSPRFHHAASVKRVLVARRKCGGSRDRGYVYRYFVREVGREYGPRQYLHVLDMGAMFAPPSFGKSLFLTEVEAWQAYADWLTHYLDRKRELIRIGEQMLAEAEAMARLKRGPIA